MASSTHTFEVWFMRPAVPRRIGRYQVATFKTAFSKAAKDNAFDPGDYLVFRIAANGLADSHRAFQVPIPEEVLRARA